MKEKILEAFENLGFKLKEVDGMGYGFKYEGLNMLYTYNENDEDFLNVSLPGIMDIDESNGLKACVLLEKINSTLKYVKAYILGGSVWLFYERELFGDEDLMMQISRIILHLENGLRFARKSITEIENDVENDVPSEDKPEDGEEAIVEEVTNNEENE